MALPLAALGFNPKPCQNLSAPVRMKRSISSSSQEHAARARRSIVAASSCSKAGIARILLILHNEGFLADGMVDNSGEDSMRKLLGKSVDEVATIQTPFGPLVQEMDIDTDPPTKWPFIHPLALIFYLSQISSAFAKVMTSCLDHCRSLGRDPKIVIFADEHRPGNVLRPDAGRATQGIYWAFSDWPAWLLSRSDCWLFFGVIRTSILEKAQGYMSGFLRKIVLTFFHPELSSFASTGGLLHRSADEVVVLKASLGGLLGDEKGLKEVFASFGPKSTKPCLSCKNVVSFLSHAVSEHSYLQSIECADPSKFDAATDAEVYEAADMVRAASGRTKKELANIETATGIHWAPNGLLFDAQCRAIVRPCTGWLRDWMHVLTVSGVANTEVMQLCLALKHHGVAWPKITEFFSSWHLPKSTGPVNADWFTARRLGHREEKHSFRGFASELLTIVPILRVFLDLVVAPTGVLTQEVASFRLLDDLLRFLSLGADRAVEYIEQIERTIRDHAVAFKASYPDFIKPKYHHLFHIVDHMRSLGRLLDCFVTERKHRTAKATAGHVFRHYERTLTTDLLSRMIENFTDETETRFIPEYLVMPRPMSAPAARHRGAVLGSLPDDILRSVRAMLRCGQVFRGDVIMTSDHTVGRVEYFLSTKLNGGENFILCVLCRMVRRGDGYYSPPTAAMAVPSDEIMGAVCWAELTAGRIRVIPPPIAVTWSAEPAA